MLQHKKHTHQCPFCQSQSLLKFTGRDYNRNKSSKKYQLYHCQECSLEFIANPPQNMSAYYEGNYHTIPENYNLKKIIDSYIRQEKFKVDILQKFKTNGTLLEIGSSTGAFAVAARAKGFDTTVIEMDANCVKFMNESLKIKAIESSNPCEAMETNQENFDVICMWHSLEHMNKPWEVIETASKYLNKDGILIIAAPNPEANQIKIMNQFWPHFDFPRHLFLFPIKWITNLGVQNDLQALYITTNDLGGIYWNRFSWAMILSKFCFIPQLKDIFWKKCIRYSHIFSKFDDEELKGSAYTVVMKKN